MYGFPLNRVACGSPCRAGLGSTWGYIGLARLRKTSSEVRVDVFDSRKSIFSTEIIWNIPREFVCKGMP